MKKAKLQSYGANVVAYMVAKLAADWGTRIDLDAIWDEQDVSPELKAMFADWAPRIHAAIVETAGKRNVTECLQPLPIRYSQHLCSTRTAEPSGTKMGWDECQSAPG